MNYLITQNRIGIKTKNPFSEGYYSLNWFSALKTSVINNQLISISYEVIEFMMVSPLCILRRSTAISETRASKMPSEQSIIAHTSSIE